MKIDLVNKQDLGASTLRQITIYQLKDKCREYNIPHCVAFVDYENAFDSSNIDIIARTRNRKCVHRNPERHIYGQLSNSTSAQRGRENQDQERSKTWGHHLPQAVHDTIGQLI